MKAKNPSQYFDAWTRHINELATLALAAGISYDDYIKTKEYLYGWRDEALCRLYPINTDKEV